MGMLRRASVLLVVLLLSGCWLQPGFGPERQSSNPFETTLTPANVAGVDQAWSAPVNLVSGGQPLVTGTGVYVAGAAMAAGQNVLAVRAFAPGSGAPLWSRDLPLDPTLGRGALVSVAKGGVLTVRIGVPETGARRSTRSTRPPGPSSPRRANRGSSIPPGWPSPTT
jgi:hypothetical protein